MAWIYNQKSVGSKETAAFVSINMTEKKVTRPNFYLFYILLFIYGDIACENYIIRAYCHLTPSIEFLLFLGLLALQVIASPIQAAISDLYCRKKSIIVSLCCSFASTVLLFAINLKIIALFPILILLTIIKGSAGNTIPLAWAGIADTQNKNYRFSFGLSTLSYTIAYLMLIFSVLYLSDNTAIAIVIFYYIAIIYLSIMHLKDIRDKNKNEIRIIKSPSRFNLLVYELKLVISELKKKHIINALIAFLLWEISVYSILLLYVDFNKINFRLISITMMLGYAFGILLLKIFNNVSDRKMSRLGLLLGSASLLPFYIHYAIYPSPLSLHSTGILVLACCYFFHSAGIALLPPTLFAMLAKTTKPHEQGRVYGLLESIDTLAFLFSTIFVLIYNFNKMHLVYIISLSFVATLISWFPFMKYEQAKPREL